MHVMEKKNVKEKKKGRPKKEKAKLSSSINLKLTEEDLKRVKERAEKLGLKATQYVRQIAEIITEQAHIYNHK